MAPPKCAACPRDATELERTLQLTWASSEGIKWRRLPSGRAYWSLCRACHCTEWPTRQANPSALAVRGRGSSLWPAPSPVRRLPPGHSLAARLLGRSSLVYAEYYMGIPIVERTIPCNFPSPLLNRIPPGNGKNTTGHDRAMGGHWKITRDRAFHYRNPHMKQLSLRLPRRRPAADARNMKIHPKAVPYKFLLHV